MSTVDAVDTIQAPTKPVRTGPLWLDIVKRILVGFVMVLIVLGLLLDLAQLVGVWVAYGPAHDGVISASNSLQQGLQAADKGLTRVEGYVTQARQDLTQVNTLATQMGDHARANSPVLNTLTQNVQTKLAPILAQAQTTATNVHDAALKVNGALEVINRFPNVNVPTFSDQLIAISNRAQEAQSAAQDLQTTLANIKSGAITKAETAITKITARIDTPLAKIQSTINTYQAKVTSAQGRVISTTNTILTWLLVFAISMTILCLVVAVALLLFFWFCLQFVIHGRFPSLRVVVDKGG
jgi:hypothetical protein